MLDAVFKEAKFAFDAIYGKITPFLKLAIDNGLLVKDGKEMLVYQAVLAFNLFYDNEFDENLILNAMSREIRL